MVIYYKTYVSILQMVFGVNGDPGSAPVQRGEELGNVSLPLGITQRIVALVEQWSQFNVLHVAMNQVS